VTFDEVMAHHGVKGMKWGQRKTTAISSPKSSKKELAKGLFAVGATVAAAVLLEHGDKILASLERKTAPRSNTPGLSSTPEPTKFIKPNRQGVHKITTMK
jgi:hypothetical protein